MISNPSTGPYTQWENSATWVLMTPMKLLHQTTGNRGGGFAITNKEETIKLMAPLTLQENISHSWGEYQSVASRILSKVAGFDDLAADMRAVGGVAHNFDKILDAAKGAKGVEKTIRSTINEVGQRAQGIKIPHNKVDNPLVYQTSPHRTITFSFELASQSTKQPIGKDIYDITERFIYYSSPNLKPNDIEVDLPYIFEIQTIPSEIIYYPVCALTSVQPDYKAPYVDGYPMTITLTLTFEDLQPIFRNFLRDKSSRVTVVGKNAKKYKELKALENMKDNWMK